MSLCPTPGPASVKSPLREIFDNPAYPVPAVVRKRAEFFLFFADVIYPMLEAYLVALNALYCGNNGRTDPRIRFSCRASWSCSLSNGYRIARRRKLCSTTPAGAGAKPFTGCPLV